MKQTVGGKKFLVFGLNWMGDVIMSLPALHEIVGIPTSEVDILTRPHLADLYRLMPGIRRIIPLDTRQGWWRNLAGFKRLRRRRYDGALVLPTSFQSALSARLSGPTFSLGYSGQWRDALLTGAVPRPLDYSRLHESQLHLHLASLMRGRARIGESIPTPTESTHHNHTGSSNLPLQDGLQANPNFSLTDVGPKFASHSSRLMIPQGFAPLPPLTRFFQDSNPRLSVLIPGISKTPYFVVAPGAAFGAAKRWHPEKFAAVADRLAREYGLLPIITGAAAEAPIAAQVTAGISGQSINLAGQTTMPELMALLVNARLLLANDSGTMHLGAALGTPVVVPVGSTDMRRTGPLTTQARLVTGMICNPPCRAKTCPRGDHRCMVSLTANQVYSACREVIHA